MGKAWLKAALSIGILAVVAAAAINADVYTATLPPGVPHHTLLRKTYAVAAFALAGIAAFPWFSRRLRAHKVALAIALLSALIEVGQHMSGSHESWKWNVFDVASGALGGYIGAAIALAYLRLTRRA